jgi:hypothetical protein
MKKDNTGKKHIINVSAMEGKFAISRRPTSTYQYGKSRFEHVNAYCRGNFGKDGIL